MSNTTEEEKAIQDLLGRKTWIPLNNAPQATLGSAIVPWDDKRAIITGGYGEENDGKKDSVFVYNKETMGTETLPSMIQPRANHASVIAGSLLFVLGGVDGLDDENMENRSILNSIEVLDLNDPREWKQYTVSLITARFNFSAVAVNEHEIFIIGGIGVGHEQLNSVEILNTVTQTISQGPPMLRSRAGLAAALIGDSIVVSGGYTGRDFTSTCEQLSIRVDPDEEARSWQPLNSNMTIVRGSHQGLSFGVYMVVVGGYNRASGHLRTTEVWDGSTGTWIQLPAMLPSVGAYGRGFVKLGNDLVCFTYGSASKAYCLFSAKGLLGHQRRQIRFDHLIADERVEIVIPLLLEGLGQRGWTSLFYECIRETSGRLIPRR